MAAANVTPMVQQYMAVKQEHQNELLFFRLGDFYEMFFDDALTASRELNLTLTKRSNGMEHMPMCGVPYHSVDGYIAKLIKKGYRIAICEQVEDPKLAKGIVERKVIKIITPGTALNEQLLEDKHNRYLVFLQQDQEKGMCLAAADVTTGECEWFLDQTSESFLNITEQLYRLQPAELVVHFTSEEMREKLQEWLAARLPECVVTRYDESTPEADYFTQHFAGSDVPDEVHSTVELLLRYLHGTVMADLSHINRLVRIERNSFMNLDVTAIRNLELVRNMTDGSKRGTLLQVLDFTNTSMGARRLRSWIESPLLDVGRIYERQEAVAELAAAAELREAIVAQLKAVADLERIVSRIEVGSANARDLVALRSSFQALPAIRSSLEQFQAGLLQGCHREIHLYDELADLLEQAIVDDPALTIREGGIIKDGYNEELDQYRQIAHNSKQLLQAMEEQEKEKTGIRYLKIGYNKVFGYYIEVRNSGTDKVPEHYVRKQTLANAERYITQELKEFETKILGAQEKIVTIEYNLFVELRDTIKAQLGDIQNTARQIAVLDVLTALAEAADNYNYVRPILTTNGQIDIREGRHPLVERLLQRELFVPNDTKLNHNDCEIMLITGPNMAGKSTYMRQTALLVLMAQIGSFVPAREAYISPVDRIFTRIGASDDLVSGQSTFMVEMNEVAQILKYATSNSLVILDEIGRGTSTFDGMSIARAVIEHMEAKIHAKTLFATHYHELTDLENEKIKNFCIAVKDKGGDITFLRRIIAGAADKSYGIHVARLAGLPKAVTNRAEKILASLEENGLESVAEVARVQQEKDQPAQEQENGMGSLFGNTLTEDLLKLDVMTMTPLEAMNELYKLQQQAKKEAGLG